MVLAKDSTMYIRMLCALDFLFAFVNEITNTNLLSVAKDSSQSVQYIVRYLALLKHFK
jgi:hypothetical protein